MYSTLIPAIQTILTGVDAVKAVYPYPLPGNPKTYPAVVFMPDSFENSFETTSENLKAYRFKLWVVADLAGTTEEAAFTSILPNVVDDVLAAFDAAWSGQNGGHRITHLIDSGLWGLSEEQKSKRAFAELTLTVRLLTSN